MNRFSMIVLMVVVATCPAMGQAPATAPATPAPAAQAAKAAQAAPAAQTAKVTNKVTYKGSAGVQAFLEAAASESLPPGEVAVEASATEVYSGCLNAVAEAHGNPVGRNTVAKSLVLAVSGVAGAEADLRPAMAETIKETYNSHVIVANGVSFLSVPEWTEAVLVRAAKRDEEKVVEAVGLQAEAERRIERLRNPGWVDQLVYWWNRD